MIKKIIVLLLVLLMMCGCEVSNQQVIIDIDEAIKNAVSATIVSPSNNNCTKTYYSYYANKDIGRLDSDELSNQFMIQNNRCSLTLDTTSILNSQIIADNKEFALRDIGSLDTPFYQREGAYSNSVMTTIPYKITIDRLEDGNYFILIQTTQFLFIAYATNGTCANTIYDMIVLLRSAVVNSTQVIYDFASESVITHSTSIITLFNDVLPESGYIADYLDDWREDTSFVIIDNKDIVEDEDLKNEELETED